MSQIYKVAIIGAGRIGADKPDHIDSPIMENILTHAHAVYHHSRTELLAVVDSDEGKLHKAARKWQPRRAFRSLDQLEDDGGQPDVVIVAVPTEGHMDLLLRMANSFLAPKLVIAEKPFCLNLKEARIVMNQYEKKKIPIMVNYTRRFSPGHQEIKRLIDSGKFGKALNCRILYTRGLRHEGSHGLDLLGWFFGACFDRMETYLIPILDRDPLDPTVQTTFEFRSCPNVVFQPCDGRQYGIFEVDICFEKARIRLIDNGLYYEIYPVMQENEWGHKSLSYRLTDVVRWETGLNHAMYYLIDNAVNFLDGKEPLRCTGEDALKVHQILGE